MWWAVRAAKCAQAIRDRLDLADARDLEQANRPPEPGVSTLYWQIIELTNDLLGHQGPDIDAHINLALARLVRHEIDDALDRRIVEIERRRRDLVADRQHAENRLNRARSPQQMANRRLGR